MNIILMANVPPVIQFVHLSPGDVCQIKSPSMPFGELVIKMETSNSPINCVNLETGHGECLPEDFYVLPISGKFVQD